MNLIATDSNLPLSSILEGFDCPAILVSADYEILATNKNYEQAFGKLDLSQTQHCFKISHGYKVPCDQAGEDCPLGAAKKSGHKERVLHIHQTPNGKEHVDVEMLPIQDKQGKLLYFVELLHPVPLASGEIANQELIGESEAFKTMLSKVARVGKTEASVLLLGESGTGKELAARAIHMASARKDKPMVTLECAGLSDSLFESELFGHVKGAFTGAHSTRKGLVELANGGTLFLDELGDIPLSMQVNLLRLLETGTFRPVGSGEVHSSDFRLICATHKNLYQMMEDGLFRSDLFYRINVFPIQLPSLRERVSDIPLLAKSLLARMDREQKYKLTQSAIHLLSNYSYRGNIRELRNLLTRALVITDTNVIDQNVIEQCIDQSIELSKNSETEILAESPQKTPAPNSWQNLRSHEANYIQQVLESVAGNKDKAAAILGISLRSLYRKIA